MNSEIDESWQDVEVAGKAERVWKKFKKIKKKNLILKNYKS